MKVYWTFLQDLPISPVQKVSKKIIETLNHLNIVNPPFYILPFF
ncbi:hypothetical protein STRPO_1033 [Streptococcus porcinus str. Jelinkova 176]|uniref:Uncharacterized protein n=1 Tax=Streptococcus porcinus str. Jelinkova 176 TaxID=873448 RepID=A0ABN0CTD1_STRPO|nr:hypothetical protein STRPO_1033 [Streptococcus porcinus str. Jelinkova 176]